ncbi:hypothetical protein HGI30_04195 [Paenibacillus albicereus]|uniref:mannan endo-1,4-beta-mannosidase n=1 Tax=Paenibacillus albicereus TaxID=2726185 RepID=A0A6H2GTU5_9BACL|nr:CIA30 family protein [Paenibacillus albicereus]QJC50841.1 hypothetical protein HGI30_04195 [Paenibacillus albicereus]
MNKHHPQPLLKAFLSWLLILALAAPAGGAGTAAAAPSGGQPDEPTAAQTVYGLAEPSAFQTFITADGDRLMDGDQEFRFASLNYPGALGDPEFAQDDALRSIRAMGGKVTRSYVPSVLRYDGANADSAFILGPDADGVMQFSEEGFRKMDRMLALANRTGVRVIVPFVDQWQWVGGIESFVNFVYPGTITGDAATDPDGWKFYTDEKVIGLFKQTVAYMLNRTNTITGVKYKDDMAVLAWETGNELGGYNQDKFPQAWTTEIARYIKEELQPQQLLLDGRFAIDSGSLTDPNIDVVGNHFYTGNFIDKVNGDRAASKGKKPYILGEFGLYTDQEPVDALFDAALQNGTSGALIWSLRPHKEDGGFYWHDENPGNWASYHWPGFSAGDYYGETGIIRTVYKYAHYMDKLDAAKTTAVPPIPAPDGAPRLLPIASVADIRWQGSVGAAGYEVQRSEDGQDWVTVGDGVSDGGRAGTKAFHDERAITGKSYEYRVRGVNESGESAWSNVVRVEAARHLVADEMSLLQSPLEARSTYAFDHTSNVTNAADSWNELGIGFKAQVGTESGGTVTYASPVALKRAAAKVEGAGSVRWFASSEPYAGYVEVEADAKDGWSTAGSLPADTRFVKLLLEGGARVKVDRVELEYDYDGTGWQPLPERSRKGFVVDREFTELPASKPDELELRDGRQQTGGQAVLANAGAAEAELVYSVPADLSSYRFVAYAPEGSAGLRLEASIDGISYRPLQPALAKEATAEGWSKLAYSSFDLPASTRYVRAAFPDGADGVGLARVELGYGSSLVPLTEAPPANVMEDGEYDFGRDDSIAARYERDGNGDGISISLDGQVRFKGSYGVRLGYELGSAGYAGLSRPLGGADLDGFDALHAWVKPDGSGNKLSFQLTAGDGRVWEAPVALSGTAARVVEIKLADFVQPQWNKDTAGEGTMDLSSVQRFALIVSGSESVAASSGSIVVDDVKLANASKLDSFEGYGGYNALVQKAFARNAGGGLLDVSLDASRKSEGGYGLRMDYDFSGPGYAGGSFTPDYLRLSGYDGFSFWLQPDGAGNELAIQFSDEDGKFWETKMVMRGSDSRLVQVPFEAFRHPGWYGGSPDARPDSSRLIQTFSLYLGGTPDSRSSAGTIYIDDIQGASFAAELEQAQVTIDKSAAEVRTLPATLRGTASGVKDVRLSIGKDRFHAPVGADGRWSYATSRIANGDKEVVAAAERFDGTAVATDRLVLKVDVPGNTYDDGAEPVVKNLLLNPGFEEAVDEAAWPVLPKHWSSKDAAGADVAGGIVKLEGGARTDKYSLVHWNDTAYEVTTSQEVSGLEPGVYEVRAWTKSKGGQQAAEVIAAGDGGAVKSAAIPKGEASWASVRLSGLEVREGKLTVAIHSKDLGGNWIKVDDLTLVRTGELEGGGATPTPQPSGEPTSTPSPSEEPTSMPSPSGDPTPSPSGEPTSTPSPSGEPTSTPSPSGEPTPKPSGEPTSTPKPSGEPTSTPRPSGEPTPTPKPSGEPTSTPSPSGEPTPSPMPTPSPTPKPSEEPTPTPSPSGEPTSTPSASPSVAPQPTDGPTASPTTSPIPAFRDLDRAPWARDAIAELTAKGILRGTEPGVFEPGKPVTRAEFITMLHRVFGLAAAGTGSKFRDVKADSWYVEAVAAAAELGLVSGSGGGRFEPGRDITREEMAVLAARYLRHAGASPASDAAALSAFRDAGQAASYAREALAELVSAGVMNGTGANKLQPKGPATRAQAAVILQRLLKLLP